jgi:tyrosyl-tRNA synthetase
MIDVKKQLEIIKSSTTAVIPEAELIKKLEKGIPLRIKLGMDPTAPDLHLGHAVVLAKMRQLQDLGHNVIFLIGDFTARIGDPTGKSKTRPPLTEQEIEKNTRTYFDQVTKILDPKKLTVVYNSEWLNALTIKDMVKLCGQVTLARLIEREDFAKRMEQNQSIGFHELLYPLFQGYDSVALTADIELGGNDQTFNLLMGRYLQEHYNQSPQVVVTTPLLEGLDGGPKMSKSLGNAIGLTEPADQAYGKLMSISDELMWHYSHVLLYESDADIKRTKEEIASNKAHPMDLKKKMARDIVARFWSPAEAEHAQKQFESLFQKKDYSQADEVSLDLVKEIWIVDLLKELKTIGSSSEAKRLIESGSIHVDNAVVSDFKAMIKPQSGMVIKVGKHRIFKIK